MKITSFLFSFFMLIGFATLAQQGGRPSPEQIRQRAEKEAREMAITLQLNEKQMLAFNEINEKFGAKMQEFRESGADREEMMFQMQTLSKERDKELKDILSKEQYKKYIKIQEEKRQERMQRRGGPPE